MNTRRLLAGSVRAMTRYRLRSSLMSLGIVVGVAALVMMRSLGSGAEKDMREKIDRMFSASSIMIVNSGGGMRGGIRKTGQLSLEDLEAIASEVEQVVDWDPVLMAGSREVRRQGRTRSLMVIGHSERARTVWERGVSEGEFFTVSDVRSTARVALVGYKVAETLFGDEDPVGTRIQIGGAPFRVKGVLEPHGVDPHGLDLDDQVHVPITTMMRRVVNREVLGSAKLIVSDPGRVEETADEIAEVLQVRHALAVDEPDDFSIFTPVHVREAVAEANRVLTVYLPATAGIGLLVAAIVIANIMLMSVRERVAEIGLRKAVGATSGQVGVQFLLESLAVTLVSGALGVGLAAVALAGATRHGVTGAGITLDSAGLGLAAALVVGVLAGVLPARQAARQEPVDALR